MRPKFLWGLIPALIYILVAVIVTSQEFNCSSGLDFHLCGLGVVLITFPSQLLFGKLFSLMGWEINFDHTPNFSDLTQVTIHIGFTALTIFLVGYGLGWLVRRALARLGTRMAQS